MPKKEVNYANTEMYKIIPLDDNLNYCYVGHTTNFKQRKNSHKSNCNNVNDRLYNIKLYKIIRENGGWNAFKMVFIEKYPCSNRREAEAREEELIKNLSKNMNSHKAFRTEEEALKKQKQNQKKYYEKNKKEIKEQQKEYYELNKEKLIEKRKELYAKNKEKHLCECGSIITLNSKIGHLKTKKHLDYINSQEN